jgi:hypothetical protein
MTWAKWSHLRGGADKSDSVATLERTVSNTFDNFSARTKSGRINWPLDAPMAVGTLQRRYFPMWWPVEPEETSLTIRLRYEVLYAEVKVRFRAVWPNNIREDDALSIAWTDLATTGGTRATETFTVDISARKRGSFVPVLMEVWSVAGEGSVVDVDTTGATYKNITLETEPSASFSPTLTALDCVRITPYDAKGGAGGAGAIIPVIDGDPLQCIRYESSLKHMYFWPWLDQANVHQDLYSDMQSVSLERHGTLEVYSIEAIGTYGTPYIADLDGGQLPLSTLNDTKLALSPRQLVGSTNRRALYMAQERLWSRRRSVWSMGPQVRMTNDSDNANRLILPWHHVNFTKLTTSGFDWQALGDIPLAEGDSFQDLTPNVLERQHMDVVVFLLAIANLPDADPLPFQLQTQTLTKGTGAVAFSSEIVEDVFEEFAQSGPGQYLWTVYNNFFQPDEARPVRQSNLQGLLERASWGDHGILAVEIPHDDTVGTGQRHLRVRMRLHPDVASQLDSEDDFFERFGYSVHVLGIGVQERAGTALENLGITAASSSTSTDGDIRRKTFFEVIGGHGVDAMGYADVLGEKGEMIRLIDNDHHLRAYLARRVLFAYGWEDDPYTTTNTVSYDEIFEVTGLLADGRDKIEVEVDFEYGEVAIEVRNADKSVLYDTLSATNSSSRDVDDDTSVSLGSDDLVLVIKFKKSGASDGKLYGVTVREVAPVASEL